MAVRRGPKEREKNRTERRDRRKICAQQLKGSREIKYEEKKRDLQICWIKKEEKNGTRKRIGSAKERSNIKSDSKRKGDGTERGKIRENKERYISKKKRG